MKIDIEIQTGTIEVNTKPDKSQVVLTIAGADQGHRKSASLSLDQLSELQAALKCAYVIMAKKQADQAAEQAKE